MVEVYRMSVTDVRWEYPTEEAWYNLPGWDHRHQHQSDINNLWYEDEYAALDAEKLDKQFGIYSTVVDTKTSGIVLSGPLNKMYDPAAAEADFEFFGEEDLDGWLAASELKAAAKRTVSKKAPRRKPRRQARRTAGNRLPRHG